MISTPKHAKLNLQKPVVLVGMMGCGKSHAGKHLAEALGIRFVDSDKEIEAAAGCTVQEIFKRDGEAKFREVERKTIAAILDGGPVVLATGGGALMNTETAQAVARKGISIWLNTGIDVLLERVAGKGGRPLLEGGDPRKVLEELLARRKPLYEKADIVVNGGAPVAQIVDSMIGALHDFMSGMAGRDNGNENRHD